LAGSVPCAVGEVAASEGCCGTCLARGVALTIVRVPLALGVQHALILRSNLRADTEAEVAGAVPLASLVCCARSLRAVGEAALLGALLSGVPAAHFIRNALLLHQVGRHVQCSGIDGGASLCADGGARVPHASGVHAASIRALVLGGASGCAGAVDDTAFGVRAAQGGREVGAGNTANTVLRVPRARDELLARGDIANRTAGIDTRSLHGIPHALIVGIATRAIEIAVVTDTVAGHTGPCAHGILLAGLTQRDTVALIEADAGAGIPHAGACFRKAAAVGELRAALLASVVEPLAERVGSASGLLQNRGELLHVVAARVDTHTLEGIPLAALRIVGLLADGLGGGAELALENTTLRVPLADSAGKAHSLGSVQLRKLAVASAIVRVAVVEAVGVHGAAGVVLVAVLAELRALSAQSLGVAVHAQEVGLAGRGRKVIAGLHTRECRRVPHAVGVGLAGAGVVVQDDALLVAAGCADAEPRAGGVAGAGSGERVLVAGDAADNTVRVPRAQRLAGALCFGGAVAAAADARLCLVVERAERVGVTLVIICTVLHIAASIASGGEGIEAAGTRDLSASGLAASAAGLLALTAGEVINAIRVLCAAGGVVASGLAGRLAGTSGSPLARGAGSAGALSREGIAVGDADSRGEVPLAGHVVLALGVCRVAVRALILAHTAIVQPLTETGAHAVACIRLEAAAAAALLAILIPAAVAVGIAAHCVKERRNAAGGANVGAEPHASSGTRASGVCILDTAGAVGLIGHTAAGRLADLSRGDPLAVAVRVTGPRGSVLGAASAGAERSGRCCGTEVTRGVDCATLLRAGRNSSVRAATDALVVEPCALGVRQAKVLCAKAGAGRLADTNRRVPLALGRCAAFVLVLVLYAAQDVALTIRGEAADIFL